MRWAWWVRFIVVALGVLGAAGMVTACADSQHSSNASPPQESSASSPQQSSATTTSRKHHRRKRIVRHTRRRKRHHHHNATRHVPRGVPTADMPNPALTPGVALPVGTAQICQSECASSVRDVPDSEKEEVYAEYGVPHVPYQHEVDHLVSLELGGSNVIANLWPEPYAGRWGARTKDVLENRLHDLVCSGRLGLRAAQHIEATNWVAAYKRYIGGTPSAPSSGLGGGGGGSGGGGGGGNCTRGYSPCLVDHNGQDYDCYGGGGNGPWFTAPGVTYASPAATRTASTRTTTATPAARERHGTARH